MGVQRVNGKQSLFDNGCFSQRLSLSHLQFWIVEELSELIHAHKYSHWEEKDAVLDVTPLLYEYFFHRIPSRDSRAYRAVNQLIHAAAPNFLRVANTICKSDVKYWNDLQSSRGRPKVISTYFMLEAIRVCAAVIKEANDEYEKEFLSMLEQGVSIMEASRSIEARPTPVGVNARRSSRHRKGTLED